MNSKKLKIPLVKNTIDKSDIDDLIDWIKTEPRLTKGTVTCELEKAWSEWLGVKYSVYVNSGSSANLAAIYSVILSGKMKNNKIIMPAVSWPTTVAPAIQLGLHPILCDCNLDNLGLDIPHFKELVQNENPAVVMIVPVLGIPSDMEDIVKICRENDIILIEDACEAPGSSYDKKKIGTFGDISTFSFYYGHHISTIEGGMVCTDNEELYHTILSIRSHGWDRDLPKEKRASLRKENKIQEFRSLYTFYDPGFNLRSTDLQAFIGLSQMKKIDEVVRKRKENYELFSMLINNSEWSPLLDARAEVSNFAFPIITTKIENLVKKLQNSGVECRPLVCGSIGRQPFWKKLFGEISLPNADFVHYNGLYVPNNHQITKDEIEVICETVNSVINQKRIEG